MDHVTTPFPYAPRADARTVALEAAVDQAVLAPSVHNTQPWTFVLGPDRVEVRADRNRQLTVMDPLGRELAQSVGAALFDLRVALSARGWAVAVDRLPRPDDPDLLAVVRAVEGAPDASLAEYEAVIPLRRTNRRPLTGDPVPDDLLGLLAALAAAEDTVLVPVLREDQRRLVARLTQQADELQNADRAYRAEIRHWTTRPAGEGDGVPVSAVPRVEGLFRVDMPQRDFDTGGEGRLPADPGDSAERTLVLLATRADHPLGWLRCGEALQHVLLELTRRGWVASPLPQAIEVPLTRTQLRAALTWDAHPQMLLRIGHAEDLVAAPRRRRGDVVRNSTRPPEPRRVRTVPTPPTWPPGRREPRPPHRPVSDGRGGTTWI
ncbi:Acg family FMN-binding oxidoreductase [Geodermatophilus sp. SYSU D01176]